MLLEVEAGGEVIIARNEKPIARLVPVVISPPRNRPKVGEILGQPFSIPDEAFAPLTPDELQKWL